MVKRLGETAGAGRLYKFLVEEYAVQFGPHHAQTLKAQENLAILLHEQGDIVAAQRLQTLVIKERTAQFGAGIRRWPNLSSLASFTSRCATTPPPSRCTRRWPRCPRSNSGRDMSIRR